MSDKVITSNYLGKAGELRVASELMLRGYNVFFSGIDDGTDLMTDNGLHIQVKCGQKQHRKHPYEHTIYSFNIKSAVSWKKRVKYGDSFHCKAHSLEGVDIVIVWAIDDDEFYIIPANDVRGKACISFTADHDKRTQSKWNRWLPYLNNWDVLAGNLPENIEKEVHECKQCGYKWQSYVQNPTRCPRCRSRWQIKRTRTLIDGKVQLLTQEEKSEINKTECSRSRWAKAKGKTLEEVANHDEISCKQCGYIWLPILDEPKICPNCHGAWYLERQRKIVDGKLVPWTEEELKQISRENSNTRWGKDKSSIIDENKVRELYGQGFSCSYIAKQLGFATVTVWQVTKKLGITRPRAEGLKLAWSQRRLNSKELVLVEK